MATASLGGVPSKECDDKPHHFVPISLSGNAGGSTGISVDAIAELNSGIRLLTKQQSAQLNLLKSRSGSPVSIIRGLRKSNETSTVPTPNETDMMVYGQGIGGLAVAPVQVEASVYYDLIRDNVTKLGGASFDVFIRNDLSGQGIHKCVIRHKSFNDTFEESFCYTATELKNQWVSFNLIYKEKEQVVDYFNWLKNNQTVVGAESLDTPPSLV
eukprot:CAMPEP_0196765132 /NCGR_PEP_ID=MMETSP1095-20130614/7645_1 /TAXON_ID=96789 ORGANISM="Chromulina nebulosa, Strain UTEXLB2642" /NCGR_SAMPLE_ID=MMETSP1095 /ASSEMBLY_ACC=CAM_ASM_000446 /LENGTH=212 /DNA_ID=CAMNT_0042122589 /DNA_START=97 /DNA_END=735 /DNA_ORIENTATION=+